MPDKGAYVIQLLKKDIGALFSGLLKLKAGTDSPFETEINSFTISSTEISQELKTLAGDKMLQVAAKIIAEPAYTVENRLGGGSIGYDVTAVCGNAGISKNVVAINSIGNDTYAIQVYDNSASYVKWWVDSFAGKNDTTIPNLVPPNVKLEEFLLVLHAVDFFKRCSYEDQLEFKADINPLRPVKTFLDTMSASIKSKDIRWLLPAFLAITPNLDDIKLNIEENDIVILTNKTFLKNPKDEKSDADMIGFGQAGKDMGVEFYRSWLLAGGFEFKKAGEGYMKKLFIAPTALANHYVDISADDKGNGIVNHQVYTEEQLQVKLDEIFDSLATGKEIQEEKKAAFCKSCGKELKEGMKFCNSCGAKVG